MNPKSATMKTTGRSLKLLNLNIILLPENSELIPAKRCDKAIGAKSVPTFFMPLIQRVKKPWPNHMFTSVNNSDGFPTHIWFPSVPKTAQESHRRPVIITQAKNHDLGVETGAKMHSSKHSGELSPASCLRPVVSGQPTDRRDRSRQPAKHRPPGI